MREQLSSFLFFLLVFWSFLGQSQTIGGYNVYYGHLHNHSSISDGEGSPDWAYRYAKYNAGLDFFGLGDHGRDINGIEYRSMKKAANAYNEDGIFTTFWGFEWTSSTYGHILVVNAEDYCSAYQSATNTFKEISQWISERQCVAFFNHPGREDNKNKEFGHFKDVPNNKFVGIELWNKVRGFDTFYYNDGYFSNDGGLNYWEEGLKRGWKLGASGAEDNHYGTWGTWAEYRMAILSKELTREALYSAMKERRFYSTLDKNIALSLKVNGREMGSTVVRGDYDLQISAFDEDNEVFTKVVLYKNGIEEQRWNINTNKVDITDDIHVSDGDYYYVIVTQLDGDEAISSPIWGKGVDLNAPPSCRVTVPEMGEHFSLGQNIIMETTAVDSDGVVEYVDFYVNGQFVSRDSSYPYSGNYVAPADGFYSVTAKAKDDKGAVTTSVAVDIKVGLVVQSVSSRIASGLDDVEERPDGRVYSNSSDIELVYDSYTGGNQIVGLRFLDMNIPQGATINSAYIQFTSDATDAERCDLLIRGHDVDNSSVFKTRLNDVSLRETTDAKVHWRPAAWFSEGEDGELQRTPDISSVVQEIVSRPGYSESSAMSFIISGSGTRTAMSYDKSTSGAAELVVEYAIGGGSTKGWALEGAGGFFLETTELEVQPALFEVYPNPVKNGVLTVKTKEANSQTLVQMFNLNGKRYLNQLINGGESTLLLRGIKPGLYYVRLKNKMGAEVKKVVVE